MNLGDSDSWRYDSVPIGPSLIPGGYYKLQYRDDSGNLLETDSVQAGSGGGGTPVSITGAAMVAVFNGVTVDPDAASVDIAFFDVDSPTWSPTLLFIEDFGGLLVETGKNQFTYTFTPSTIMGGMPNMLISGSVSFEAPLNANPYDSPKTSVALITGTLYVNMP